MAVDTRSGDHVAIKVMSRAMIQSSDRLGISVQRESDLLKVRQKAFLFTTKTILLCFFLVSTCPSSTLFV